MELLLRQDKDAASQFLPFHSSLFVAACFVPIIYNEIFVCLTQFVPGLDLC